MNIYSKRLYFISIFFSVLLSAPIYSEHHYAKFSAFGDHSGGTDSSGNRFHSDYSHESRWNDFGNERSPVRPNNFKEYTAQDFHNHFARGGYTEKDILNQPCLYMFDDFVKFAQTYSSYSCTIKELHAVLKNITFTQKFIHYWKGTYCANLQKRIHYLYSELSTLKNEVPKSTVTVMRDISLETFATQLPEYEALKDTYQAYTPSLYQAIEKRLDVYNSIADVDYTLQYARKSYNLNNNVKQFLSQYGHDTTRFTECYGNQVHQAIHQESLDILDRIHSLPHNSLLYDHQEALVDFTVAMVDYNHECMTDKAMMIGDLCWTLLDYGQAIAEGAALGAYSAVHDMVNNPLNAALCIFAGKEMLAFQLSKALYNVADIGLTSLVDSKSAREKWNKYAEPLNTIIDAINKKEITLRDGLKGGTALFVGWKAQGKLLGGLGKFCNTIQQKSINFIKNSPLLKPVEYLITPEGLLFKVTAQSNRFKKYEQFATNLKNSIDNKISRNISIKSLVKQKKLPTKGKMRYVPPKKLNVSEGLPRVSWSDKRTGYVDRFGNVWLKGESRTKGDDFEWDVQLSKQGISKVGWMTRDNTHLNVSLDGKVTHK